MIVDQVDSDPILFPKLCPRPKNHSGCLGVGHIVYDLKFSGEKPGVGKIFQNAISARLEAIESQDRFLFSHPIIV